MPKKKKSQLKPIVRGFQTTSIPKKPAEPTSTGEDNEEDTGTEENQAEPPAPEDKLLIRVEDKLQSFSEKWQDRTDREIGRLLKVSSCPVKH